MDFSSFTADGVQEDNIAGLRRFWKVITKVFTGEYPAKAHVVAGEVTADVLAFLPEYYEPAEYILPNDTKGFDYELGGADGSEGFKHMIVFEKAGHNNALVAEMQKDMNARAVYFVEDTAGQIIVVGSSVKGLKLTSKGGSGKQGGEKRGAVMTAEEVGYKWAPVPMSALQAEAWLIRARGFGPFFQRNIYLNYTFTIGSTKRLQPGDGNGVLLAGVMEYEQSRAGVGWRVGDTVLITHGVAGTIGSPPRLSMSLKDGWCKAEVAGFFGNGFVDFTVLEIGVEVFTSHFVVFHKDRPKFTGLTTAEDPSGGYYGPWALTYTGGILPYIANDNVYVQFSDGFGRRRRVSGRFVSQVGTTINIDVADVEHTMSLPPSYVPPATIGYEMMENVIFV